MINFFLLIKNFFWLLFSFVNLFILFFSVLCLIFFFQHLKNPSYFPTNYNSSLFDYICFKGGMFAPFWVHQKMFINPLLIDVHFSIFQFLIFPLIYLFIISYSIFTYFRDYNLTILPIIGLLILLIMPYGFIVGSLYIVCPIILIFLSVEYNKYVHYLKEKSLEFQKEMNKRLKREDS